jgi:hypothetical protein
VAVAWSRLLFASWKMYSKLVFHTGAISSEHYSVLKQSEYAAYQDSTTRFFPERPRGLSGIVEIREAGTAKHQPLLKSPNLYKRLRFLFASEPCACKTN